MLRPGSRSAYMPSKALLLFGEYDSHLAAACGTNGTVGALRGCRAGCRHPGACAREPAGGL
ncbi:hypothetical protein TSAR_008089 [Trichomalopsis sarcophagae]|uniref:Uncharacterized protein n=1 Tax=Trichomalopsis sarcophagae TaxID=543379 RepID=A0A232FP89_9HYME|nr:hypothetical protein TSAR_008089 [Trichomalopsis sarcophagae]